MIADEKIQSQNGVVLPREVPADVAARTVFEWVPTARIFVAPYGRAMSQKKVDALKRNFNLQALGALYLSYRPEHDNYAALDGQHRKVAAEQLGYTSLPAMVYHGLSYQEEADLYVRFATVNQQTALDKIRARIAAGDPTALKLRAILNEYGNGMDIATRSLAGPGEVAAVATLEGIYEVQGEDVLKETCRVISAAWETNARGWSAPLLQGIAMLLVRYRETSQFRMERLVDRLRLTTPEALIARSHLTAATHKRDKTGAVVGITITDWYNEGLRTSGRLPRWDDIALSNAEKERRREVFKRTLTPEQKARAAENFKAYYEKRKREKLIAQGIDPDKPVTRAQLTPNGHIEPLAEEA